MTATIAPRNSAAIGSDHATPVSGGEPSAPAGCAGCERAARAESWAAASCLPLLGLRSRRRSLGPPKRRRLPALEHLDQLGFREDRDAQLNGLVELGACLRAGDHVARLLAHARGHLRAEILERRTGLVAGEALERAREHEGEARERLIAQRRGPLLREGDTRRPELAR